MTILEETKQLSEANHQRAQIVARNTAETNDKKGISRALKRKNKQAQKKATQQKQKHKAVAATKRRILKLKNLEKKTLKRALVKPIVLTTSFVITAIAGCMYFLPVLAAQETATDSEMSLGMAALMLSCTAFMAIMGSPQEIHGYYQDWLKAPTLIKKAEKELAEKEQKIAESETSPLQLGEKLPLWH